MVACFLLDRPISGQKFKAFAAVQHSKNKLPFSPLNCAQRVHKLMVPERTLPHTPSRVAHQIVAARTESSDLPLGTAIPEFELVEPLSGKALHLKDIKGHQGTLIAFICNHCPFVIHLKDAIITLSHEVAPKGVAVIAISSNSVITHPQDGPEKMAEDAKTLGYPFPYLYDESQDTAKAYQAVCTPEFYLADSKLNLVYHGQFDGSRPSNDVPVTGEDVKAAIDSLLQGRVLEKSKPSMGCGIKWHPSKQPV